MIYLLLLYIIGGAIWIYMDSKNHDKIQRTIADIKSLYLLLLYIVAGTMI